jgi:alkylhydroperoxidase family enzyme
LDRSAERLRLKWQASDCFDEIENVVLACVDYLPFQRGRVPDGVFAKLKDKLSEQAIIELTNAICAYGGFSVLTKALRLEFDDRDDPVVEVAAPAAFGGGNFMGEGR